LVTIIGLFIMPEGTVSRVKGVFQSEEEHTLLLDEFILNLQTENKSKSYLKIEVALMYKDKKAGQLVETNVNKIRDIVLNNLRKKTPTEMLNVKDTDQLKDEIKDSVNDALGQDVIKDVYYTNLIIQ